MAKHIEEGKTYKFIFALRRLACAKPPDTIARVIEISNTEFKVDVDGIIATWSINDIQEAVPL
jgi:hypothetical protein